MPAALARLADGARPGSLTVVGTDPAGGRLTAARCLELFDAQLASRHLDLAAGELRARGAGFYTIGSSGHEGNAGVAAALRLTDPALLHYRSGAFYMVRAAQADPPRDGVTDVLLGMVAASAEPMAGRPAQGLRAPRPEHHPADLDHRLAPAPRRRPGLRARPRGQAGPPRPVPCAPPLVPRQLVPRQLVLHRLVPWELVTRQQVN